MSNHFHLVSETPRGNLVRGMQWLLGVPPYDEGDCLPEMHRILRTVSRKRSVECRLK
jgi:hypothetical protein